MAIFSFVAQTATLGNIFMCAYMVVPRSLSKIMGNVKQTSVVDAEIWA